MKLIIGTLETRVKTYHGRPDFHAYVQIWDMDRPMGNMIVHNRLFEDVTHRQWQRFRRLQDALARVPAGEVA